jgi:ornithine carbamoyltransferase
MSPHASPVVTDFGTLPHKDLLSVAHLAPGDVDTIFHASAILKAGRETYTDLLKNKKLAMIFEKESLRTRFTFDVGMQDLGGSAVFYEHRHARLGSRESIADMARNLERWVHGIVARTFRHKVVEELAKHASIPVINGLTDSLHPCQALTDYFTLTEKWGSVKGKTLYYIGDGNNTCNSLIDCGAKLGCNVIVCAPENYEPHTAVVDQARGFARESGATVEVVNIPGEEVEHADAVYTDVWASMHQEGEIEERNAIFGRYQVNEALMAKAKPGALFMHCLPAHRGWEVTPGVLDGAQSVVFDQAENRLHVQKAILVLLMGKKGR